MTGLVSFCAILLEKGLFFPDKQISQDDSQGVGSGRGFSFDFRSQTVFFFFLGLSLLLYFK